MPESTDASHISPSQASALPYTHGLTGVDVPLDNVLSNILWGTMIGLALVILVGRTAQMANAHLRLLLNLESSSSQQRYWSEDKTTIWPWLKKHLLYAPLWKKRHNNEIRLSSAMNVGTLPSRLHMTILVLYLVSNVVYCAILDYKRPKAALLAELRGRTGHLSVVNMVPLIVLAGRNNPFIYLLRVSFDTYNLFHRWIGRVVVVEAIIHTIAWAVNDIDAKGSNAPSQGLRTAPFLAYGMLGTAAFAGLLLQSPSIIRHAFYETFLHIHQLLALAAVAGVWIHCHLGDLPGSGNIKWAVALWAIERCVRFARIIYRNFSRTRGLTRVTVEAIPGSEDGIEACRVAIELPRPWTHVAGTHAYIYLPSISLWMNHPFSIAWSDTRPISYRGLEAEKLPSYKSDLELADRSPTTSTTITPTTTSSSSTTTTLYMIIAKRTGMTSTLYDRALRSQTGTLHLSGLLEGPYTSGTTPTSLHSYGTCILFAAGVGITHQLPHVCSLLAAHSTQTCATRRITLIWSVKSTATLEWVRPWMDEILALPNRKQVLRVMIFVTRPRCAREVCSRSETVLMFPGRCEPKGLLRQELMMRREGSAVGGGRRVGACCVTVCGPGAFADEVRAAVREVGVEAGTCDFLEEAFTW